MNDFIKSLLGGTNKNTNFVSALTGVQSPAQKPVAQTPAKPAVTPTKTVVSGNPSAVSPAVKSPAGQAYVSSMSSTPKITNVDNVNKTYMSDGQQYSIDPSTGRYSLSSSVKQPVQGQTTQASTLATPTPQVQTTATQTQTPSTRDAYIQAYKSYQDAQKVSAEEKSAREAYNNFLAEQSKAVAGREGRGFGTPVELVRGEQEKLLRQTQPELARLQGDIGIAQTGREAEINAAKTGLDMQKDLLGMETEANKPLVVDGVAYQRQADGSLKALTQKEQEAFNLSEGQSRYAINPTTGQYELVASKGKTYAPSQYNQSGNGITTDTSNSVITSQPAFRALRAKEQTQAVALENLIRELKLYRDDVGEGSVNLFGADSATVSSRLNSLLFAAAQAEGTGALQAADREVLEGSIPNPTTLGGAFTNVRQGGIEGVRNKIDTQINKYTANLRNLGLSPEDIGTKAPTPPSRKVLVSPDGRSEVDVSLLTPAELIEAQNAGWQ